VEKKRVRENNVKKSASFAFGRDPREKKKKERTGVR